MATGELFCLRCGHKLLGVEGLVPEIDFIADDQDDRVGSNGANFLVPLSYIPEHYLSDHIVV